MLRALHFYPDPHTMHTSVLVVLILLNGVLGAAFTGVALDAETPLKLKLIYGSLAAAMWLATAALAACRLVKLSPRAVLAFRAWCIALPALFLLGSLDTGMISGQEFMAAIMIAGFSWLNWRAVSWFVPVSSRVLPTEPK